MSARTAAERMVDHALDYVGADRAYRANNRERAVQAHMPWCAFEAVMRERRAVAAVSRLAVALMEVARRVGERKQRRAA